MSAWRPAWLPVLLSANHLCRGRPGIPTPAEGRPPRQRQPGPVKQSPLTCRVRQWKHGHVSADGHCVGRLTWACTDDHCNADGRVMQWACHMRAGPSSSAAQGRHHLVIDQPEPPTIENPALSNCTCPLSAGKVERHSAVGPSAAMALVGSLSPAPTKTDR